MIKKTKPIASLSFDLDNQWSYLKTHGDKGWETFPSYLDVVVPRVLQILGEMQLTITFFVVGQDAALDKNYAAIKSIADGGHEIANHSFNHGPWLHLYSEQEIEADILQAEDYIKRITGKKPIGFRGPGYSISGNSLKVLARCNYFYDASTLPTFIGPLGRIYYFMTSHMSREEKRQRKQLFGTWNNGLRPLRPYRWKIDPKDTSKTLVEIPVTTIPVFRIPFHLSYIIYISRFSAELALLYFKGALALCRLNGVSPSLLLHPLDFLGNEDVQGLSFFPGMNLPYQEKMRIVQEVLRIYSTQFHIVTMREQALQALNTSELQSHSIEGLLVNG